MRSATWIVLTGTILAQPQPCGGQSAQAPPVPATERQAVDILKFLGGAGTGLVAHEASHLLFDALFDADPRLKRVEFGQIPFFAITHRKALSPRREFIVSSAGFWAQHASSEWLLIRRPRLKDEHAPFAKGLLAFNVLTSVGYGAVAMARAGPDERDTRGMATATGIDERWIGALVLAPAALDAWRYVRPEAAWARWASRAAKIGMVLLVIQSAAPPARD